MITDEEILELAKKSELVFNDNGKLCTCWNEMKDLTPYILYFAREFQSTIISRIE